MSASRARRTRVVLETASRFELEQPAVVAIKIGGSLLTSARLIDRIEWLLEERPGTRPLIICGGGAAADTVRNWQRLHGISEKDAHRLALAAMSFNEQVLQSALPGSCLVRDLDELEDAWEQEQRPILESQAFIEQMDELLEQPLPASWDMTSDSIAAWCGHLAGAEELILAKSTDLPQQTTLESARDTGLVDQYFGRARCPESVSWVNLRADRPKLADWV